MENNRGDYYNGDKNPSVFLGTNAIDNGEQSLCFAFGIKFLQKKEKAFLGFFLDKFFSGLGGIEIGERWRDFRVLFLWFEFYPNAVDRAI